MKAEVRIDILEINGSETQFERPTVKITSHWNRKNYVVIQFPRGNEYVVDGDELKSAIDRVTGIK